VGYGIHGLIRDPQFLIDDLRVSLTGRDQRERGSHDENRDGTKRR
jgi:hypothetical protein